MALSVAAKLFASPRWAQPGSLIGCRTPGSTARSPRAWALALICTVGMLVHAAATAGQAAQPQAMAQQELQAWLDRVHAAARTLSYQGTLVVTSPGRMTSARIVHVCDGDTQLERIDVLDGQPRRILRRDDRVHTLYPDTKVAVVEESDVLKAFPALLQASASRLAQHYAASRGAVDRVAGRQADVLELAPKDGLRFGHRLWSDTSTGLLLRSEVLDGRGRVLETNAFSDLTIDRSLESALVERALDDLGSYDVLRVELEPTSLEFEGWRYRELPPGFQHVQCVKRRSREAQASVLHTVFTDGLAHVSVFVEPYDARPTRKEQLLGMGATHSLSRRIGDWWVTVVGEVPPKTLKAFAGSLERAPR